MVCLNLVHNKAEEEFSLLEMTAAILSLLVRDDFSLKYHECCFFLRRKRGFYLHFSVLALFLFGLLLLFFLSS